ncbi:MAG TPA: ABC transporter ATP-binding protein [Thermodesulfobacteriota bacterium]|nr:ABC transporter ATP-binding protein [Thermodesulfobacteriota bacterium]
MLQAQEVGKSFDGFKAVNGADLQVERREIVAIIGPNGAGKTTLFNLITGQLKPDYGKITFKGEEITGLPPFEICRKGISRSFQVENFFPRLSVFENVEVSVLAQKRRSYSLLPAVRKQLIEESQEMLRSIGLIKKSRITSGLLSHGDRKLLEIAIALASKPELLILDEPTAGMSPEETEVTIQLIKHLSVKMGLTILFCEHNMDLVFSIAHRIMVMRQGRSIIQGNLDEVRNNHEVQEAYLGESQK